jgi:hypothetical protein
MLCTNVIGQTALVSEPPPASYKDTRQRVGIAFGGGHPSEGGSVADSWESGDFTCETREWRGTLTNKSDGNFSVI